MVTCEASEELPVELIVFVDGIVVGGAVAVVVFVVEVTLIETFEVEF